MREPGRRHTPSAIPPTAGRPAPSKTVYVLRLGSDPYVWLKRQAPVVTWGPQAQALEFKSKGDARKAAARLTKFSPLVVIELDEEI